MKSTILGLVLRLFVALAPKCLERLEKPAPEQLSFGAMQRPSKRPAPPLFAFIAGWIKSNISKAPKKGPKG